MIIPEFQSIWPTKRIIISNWSFCWLIEFMIRYCWTWRLPIKRIITSWFVIKSRFLRFFYLSKISLFDVCRSCLNERSKRVEFTCLDCFSNFLNRWKFFAALCMVSIDKHNLSHNLFDSYMSLGILRQSYKKNLVLKKSILVLIFWRSVATLGIKVIYLWTVWGNAPCAILRLF